MYIMSYTDPYSRYNVNNPNFQAEDVEYHVKRDPNKEDKDNFFKECFNKIVDKSLVVIHYTHSYFNKDCYAIGKLKKPVDKTVDNFYLTDVDFINDSTTNKDIEIGDTSTSLIKYNKILELYVKTIDSDKDILNMQPTNDFHRTIRWFPYMNARIQPMRDELNIYERANIFDSAYYYRISYAEPIPSHPETIHRKDNAKVVKSSISRVGTKHKKGGKKAKKTQKQRKSRKNKSK